MSTKQTPPTVGSNWPEMGGTYAGIMRGDDGTLYHLIVSDDSNDTPDLEWSKRASSVESASSTWDGLANTKTLQKHPEEHPILDALKPLNPDDGWYLPAQRELSLCWATVPHIFQRDDWYWSSTQVSDDNAWFQSFDNGLQGFYLKDYQCRVRAVRRLVIQ